MAIYLASRTPFKQGESAQLGGAPGNCAASGVTMPAPPAGTTDPQAMFESWVTDYMNAYSISDPISTRSGLTGQFKGSSELSHLPIPPSGLGDLEELVSGEPVNTKAPQGYDVPFKHITRAPQGLVIRQEDMASDRVGMITANVTAKGNDAGMFPDFLSAMALEAGTTQLSFDRKPVFSVNQHLGNPVGPSTQTKYTNLYGEKLEVPGLVKIVNGMSGYRNESGLPINAGKKTFAIIVPPDLEGDLSVLTELERTQNGSSNWAYKRFVGIVLSTLKDPKAFYVAILNGPVRPIFYSIFIPMRHTTWGPDSPHFEKYRTIKMFSNESSAALLPDWRVISKSVIP